MLISTTRTGAAAGNAVTRTDLLGQLNLEAGEEHHAQLDLAITAAQHRLSEWTGRAFGSETWVGYYSDVVPGRAEICPNGSTATIVLETWDGDAWSGAVAGIRLTPGQPPVWHPPASPLPSIPSDNGPTWKGTATCTWTVPDAMKQAIILLAAEIFTNGPAAEIPASVAYLAEPYRCALHVT